MKNAAKGVVVIGTDFAKKVKPKTSRRRMNRKQAQERAKEIELASLRQQVQQSLAALKKKDLKKVAAYIERRKKKRSSQ